MSNQEKARQLVWTGVGDRMHLEYRILLESAIAKALAEARAEGRAEGREKAWPDRREIISAAEEYHPVERFQYAFIKGAMWLQAAKETK